MQIHDNPTLKAEARNLNFYYGEAKALKNINMPIYDKKVTALIGPSGCGKSTYLRSFNRMHDLYPGNRYEGEIRFFPDNTNLLAPEVDPIEVRMRIGMVFQKPNPFPKSIFENVAYGLRVRGENNKRVLDDKVEHALQGRGDLGRSEGSPAGAGAQPLRRPAAAPVHRPRPGDRPRIAAVRRADLGARPDRHRRHRRTGA
jgi:ABC-type polar amino acid transport system ATPase subunit